MSGKFWKPNVSANPLKKPMQLTGEENPGKGRKFKLAFGVLGFFGFIILVLGFLAFFFVLKPAFALKAKVDNLQNTTKVAKKAFLDRDLVLLEKTFNQMEAEIKDFRDERDRQFGWARNLPKVRDYYADSDYFLNSAIYLIDAGREFIKLITPFADAMGLKINEDQKPQTLSFADAFASWIALMPKIAQDIDPLVQKLEMVSQEINKVDASKYPESFRGTPIRSTIEKSQDILSSLSSYSPDIKKALILIPRVLAVGTPEKRYMIIMQNNAEIRPTGGFWTNYATFKVKNAQLSSDFTSKDMYSIDYILDAIDSYTDFSVGMPTPIRRYLLLERWYARDANFSPDFPTSIDVFMNRSYKKAMQINPAEIKPVEGVFAIDTVVVQELLEITGPATVNGITYTKDNVVLELEKIASLALREQANRKKVLGDLMERMLVNVFESDKNLWPKLIEKGVDLLNRKHILVYMNDPEVQALLEKYNFAGRLVDVNEGDYMAVISSNLAGDKSNLFVRRKITSVSKYEDGQWKREVKISFNYGPAEGEYRVFAATYRDYLRLYVPKGSRLISVEGSDNDDVGSADELNKTYFHGYIVLPPGGVKEITFKYILPQGTINGNDYKLYIQKQPGQHKENYEIVVNGKSAILAIDSDYKYSIPL